MEPAKYGTAAWKDMGKDREGNKLRRVKGELIKGNKKDLGIHYSIGEWGTAGWKMNTLTNTNLPLKDNEAKWLYIDEDENGAQEFSAYWLGPSDLVKTIERNLPDDNLPKEEHKFYTFDTKHGWEVFRMLPADKVFLATYNKDNDIKNFPQDRADIERKYKERIQQIKNENPGYTGDGSPPPTPASRATIPPKRSLPSLPPPPPLPSLPPPPPPVVSQGGRRKSKRSKRSKRSKKTRRHSRK